MSFVMVDSTYHHNDAIFLWFARVKIEDHVNINSIIIIRRMINQTLNKEMADKFERVFLPMHRRFVNDVIRFLKC